MVKKKDSDITDEEFRKLYAPFYDNVNDFMIKYIVPEVVAFQLANFHYRGCLDKSRSSLLQHYNSMNDILNLSVDFGEVKEEIVNLLNIKYNLKIVNEVPLRLDKWNK